MLARKVFAPIAALCVSGCAALKSTPVDYADARGVGNGMHYALPKGVFRIELLQRGASIRVAVSEPFFVGDLDASYLLQASSGALANQEYLLVVQPQTRLLSYVNSSSEGQAGQILRNLTRSAAGLGAREESSRGQRTIYSRIVDPFALPGCDFATACDMTSVSNDLRNAALAHFNCAAADGGLNPELCARIEADPKFFQLELNPLSAAAPVAAAGRRANAESCRRSICYRAPAPYSISLSVSGVVDLSEIVLLPNEAPVTALNVPAGVFADANARIELYQGMPARYAVDRDNELVAISLLPFNIVREGFAAVSEVFQFRVNYNNARVSMLESEARREDAESEYRARRAAAAAAASEEATELIGDQAENSRTFSREESSRPMEDDTGQTQEAASLAATAAAPARHLFDVPLAGDDEEAGDSADIP
jgi:hypothetical protein